MDVQRLGWSGTRTDDAQAQARFYRDVLGLRLAHFEPHFWVFELPDGNHVEVFGPQYPGKEHFNTGPVVWSSMRSVYQPSRHRPRTGRHLAVDRIEQRPSTALRVLPLHGRPTDLPSDA
jgi:catechol 2,3-dioxygenase-like lactoylglutathione lyase family enzyme